MGRSAFREATPWQEHALQALTHLPETRDRLEQAVDLRLLLRNSLQPMGELRRAPRLPVRSRGRTGETGRPAAPELAVVVPGQLPAGGSATTTAASSRAIGPSMPPWRLVTRSSSSVRASISPWPTGAAATIAAHSGTPWRTTRPSKQARSAVSTSPSSTARPFIQRWEIPVMRRGTSPSSVSFSRAEALGQEAVRQGKRPTLLQPDPGSVSPGRRVSPLG